MGQANGNEDLSDIDVSDPTSLVKQLPEEANFDPSKIDPATLNDLAAKMDSLVAAADRLAAAHKNKAEAAKDQPVESRVTLDEVHSHVRKLQADERIAASARVDMSALPRVDSTLTIFFECDELMVSGDVESALLGAEVAARGYADREARLAALSALRLPLDEAMTTLADRGVTLRPEFIDFVEQAAVRRLRLCCLSRGLKPVIRQLLRDEGLGHVEVIAHDMFVDRDDGHRWSISLRDDSSTGHDKAESVRRALQGTKAKGKVLLVGRLACDFAPVQAGSVDCLYAPEGSGLAEVAAAGGVRHRTFTSFDELSRELFSAA